MGDRANVCMLNRQGKKQGAVWLYTHWGGNRLAQNLRDALKKKWRWGDSSYLARIILDHMVPKQDHGTETGWGISAFLNDNQHPVLVVDCECPKGPRVVVMADEDDNPFAPTGKHKVYTFDEFSMLDNQTCSTIMNPPDQED